jgi:hypothetical protein
MEILDHFLLSNATRGRLIGNDIKADYSQVRAFYELNPRYFKTPEGELKPFVEVIGRAKELATERLREKVLGELGRALSRDLFPGVVYEDNWIQYEQSRQGISQ